MMKFLIAFIITTSCTLLYLVTCHEDVIRIPETDSKVDVKSIVPKCFIDSVDARVKQEGYATVKGITINPISSPGLFILIVSQILDETLKLLDKFTVLIVAMVERNKTNPSLESVLDFIEVKISKLSRCLEFLFDNGADVTDALTGYIFYSDFKNIFKTDYGENYTYKNITEMMVFRIDRQQWQEYLQRVPTGETYQELHGEVEQALDDIFKVYRQLIVKSSVWILPQCLKWRKLLESNTSFADLFRENIVEDNENIYIQYLKIKREFDSVKVMDFYVNVGKALRSIILETAIDMMNSFLKLILRLITYSSNRDNSFAHISRANGFVAKFLTSLQYFENWMSYSKRLQSSKRLLGSPVIQVLHEYLNYCKSYNSRNFPNTVAEFLDKFIDIFQKHIPDIELVTAKISSELVEKSITQIHIIDNMERNMKIMTMLLEETSGRYR